MTLAIRKQIDRVNASRDSFLSELGDVSQNQALFRPSQDEWAIMDIIEHIVLAEQVGLNGMIRAIEALQSGRPLWTGNSPNEGLSIEEVVENTWQPKEIVPDVARPRWGGSLTFWTHSLKANAMILEELVSLSKDLDLTKAIYPHPISGPLDVRQRIDFLAFHLDRHQAQISYVKSHVGYPTY